MVHGVVGLVEGGSAGGGVGGGPGARDPAVVVVMKAVSLNATFYIIQGR